MSGMDMLNDEALDRIIAGGAWATEGEAVLMARELLAHRRASQAAPAEEWEACTCGPCPLHQAAPAPSDGLREALAALEAKASAVSSAHARKGGVGFAVAEMGAAIIAARAILTPAPAQEGDRQ